VVTVTGTNFVPSPLLLCRFGTVYRWATYVSASALRCIAGPQSAAGSLAVEVSNNNQDWTTNNIGFLYYSALSLSRPFLA
jgi:hypothetical protein